MSVDDKQEARAKARTGLDKVMSGDPAEQATGNALIEEATSLEPDAVDEVRCEIRRRTRGERASAR